MKDVDPLIEIGLQFSETVGRLKQSQPLWVDLQKKSTLFQERLKQTCTSYSDYLDALQRLVDTAQYKDGGAKDLAPILTKMYVKERGIEGKLQNLCRLLNENYNCPMKEKLKEWKETVDYLDSRHNKEQKRRSEDVRKAVIEAERLKKKVLKKGKTKKQGQLGDAERSKEALLYSLQQFEQHSLRGALLQERAHYCSFIAMMTPCWEVKCELIDDGSHLRDVTSAVIQASSLPTKLPPDAEASIHRIRLVAATAAFDQGPEVVTSPRSSFVSNSSSTSGVSSGGSFESPKMMENGGQQKNGPFNSFDSLGGRSYSDQVSSAYGSSPSVCLNNTRGVVADINKFVSNQTGTPTPPPPLQNGTAHQRRGSGEYHSLSPVQMETYENLGDAVPEQQQQQQQQQTLTQSSVSPYNGLTPAALPTPEPNPEEENEEPLYENIAEQESYYDVPPPPPPATEMPPPPPPPPPKSTPSPAPMKAFSPMPGAPLLPAKTTVHYAKQNGKSPENGAKSPYEVQQNGMKSPYAAQQNGSHSNGLQQHQNDFQQHPNGFQQHQNGVNGSVTPQQQQGLNGAAHQNGLPQHQNGMNGTAHQQHGEAVFAAPQPPPVRSSSVCSRHSTTSNDGGGGKIGAINAYLERRRSILSQNRSNSDLTQDYITSPRHSISNGSSHYAAVRPLSVCSNTSDVAQPGPPSDYGRSLSSAGDYRTNGYAADGRRASDKSTYGGGGTPAGTGRSESRLSLKSQPPHYATMTARPSKRTISLTSLNSAHAFDPDLLGSNGHNTGSKPELGQEISDLCQQITRGGTLKPSQMRMMGMRPGDSSTIKRSRATTKEQQSATPASSNFDALINLSCDIQHLNLAK